MRSDNMIGGLERLSDGHLSIFYRLQNAFSPVEIEEGAADFRLISQKVARVFRETIREQNQFLRGLFQWAGFRSTTVVFVSPPRELGRTKYRTFTLVGVFRRRNYFLLEDTTANCFDAWIFYLYSQRIVWTLAHRRLLSCRPSAARLHIGHRVNVISRRPSTDSIGHLRRIRGKYI